MTEELDFEDEDYVQDYRYEMKFIDELERILYVNRVFARSGCAADDPECSHYLCDSKLDEHIKYDRMTKKQLDEYIPPLVKHEKERKVREKELEHLFSKRNMTIRSDSRVARSYISRGLNAVKEYGIHLLTDIVDNADEMDFLHSHANYKELVQKEIAKAALKIKDINSDSDDELFFMKGFTSTTIPDLYESCKPLAIKKFLKNKGDRKLIPKHLFVKYKL